MGTLDFNWDYHVENGRAFSVGEYFDISSGDSLELVLINPNDSGVKLHIRVLDVTGTAEGTVEIYYNPTIVTDGTNLPIVNRKLDSNKVSVATVQYGGTYSYSTTKKIRSIIPGGSANFRSGGNVSRGLAFVIDAGRGILIKITNTSSQDGEYGVLLEWWEDD